MRTAEALSRCDCGHTVTVVMCGHVNTGKEMCGHLGAIH